MSASTVTMFIYTALWISIFCVSGCDTLHADLPVKQCHDEVSSVTVTNTRLELNTALLTVTHVVDVVPVLVTVTATDCATYTVTQVDVVSEYRAPRIVLTTDYVTDSKIEEKTLVYTSIRYHPQTISITYSSQEVETLLSRVVAPYTSTSTSTATVVSTLEVAETVTYIQTDTSTYLTHVPSYVSRTRTEAWPIYRTVYQREYVKTSVAFVSTVTETSTVYHCSFGYLQALFQ